MESRDIRHPLKLNLDLVRQGLSPYYTKYGRSQKYDTEFRAAEKLARKEKLNIWGDPELIKKYLRLKSKCCNTGRSCRKCLTFNIQYENYSVGLVQTLILD